MWPRQLRAGAAAAGWHWGDWALSPLATTPSPSPHGTAGTALLGNSCIQPQGKALGC